MAIERLAPLDQHLKVPDRFSSFTITANIFNIENSEQAKAIDQLKLGYNYVWQL